MKAFLGMIYNMTNIKTGKYLHEACITENISLSN